MVSERLGAEVTLTESHRVDDLPQYLKVFTHLLSRPRRPLRRIVIQRINGESAATSPFTEAFRRLFDVAVEHSRVVLHRRFSPHT